jgi:hypothetical protein
MVALIAVPDLGDITDDTQIAIVILPRARVPRTTVLDMNLAVGVYEPKEHARQNGDEIFLVVNVREGGRVERRGGGRGGGAGIERLDVVRPVLVAHAREPEDDDADVGARGKVRREVDRVNRSDWGAERVADERDRGACVVVEGGLDGGEDLCRCARLGVCEPLMYLNARGYVREKARIERLRDDVCIVDKREKRLVVRTLMRDDNRVERGIVSNVPVRCITVIASSSCQLELRVG